MTEQEARKLWQEEAKTMTLEKLPAFMEKLATYAHDYGTICVAMGAAAVAAIKALEHSPTGGITGFQAGAVFWEFQRGWGVFGKDRPIRMLQYEYMLYPQYESDFSEISQGTWDWLKGEAAKKLIEMPSASSHVREHWQQIVEGNIPFGFHVEPAWEA